MCMYLQEKLSGNSSVSCMSTDTPSVLPMDLVHRLMMYLNLVTVLQALREYLSRISSQNFFFFGCLLLFLASVWVLRRLLYCSCLLAKAILRHYRAMPTNKTLRISCFSIRFLELETKKGMPDSWYPMIVVSKTLLALLCCLESIKWDKKRRKR